jgi:hypothetical protein
MHTLEDFYAQGQNDSSQLPNRHMVTRVLKASRFIPPEVVELSQEGVQAWVLSTDG